MRRSMWAGLATVSLLVGLAACSDGPSDTTTAPACGDEGIVALLGRERPDAIGQPELVAVSADGEARGVSGDWVTPDGALAPGGSVVLVRADGDYESAGPGSETLWVRPADGSEPRQLTDGPNDSVPSVSPDGDEVAFTERDLGEGTQRYRVAGVPIGGGDVVGVTPWDDAGLLGDVAWSPDGEQLAYLRQPYDGGPGNPAPVELRVVDAGGGTGRRVAAPCPTAIGSPGAATAWRPRRRGRVPLFLPGRERRAVPVNLRPASPGPGASRTSGGRRARR